MSEMSDNFQYFSIKSCCGFHYENTPMQYTVILFSRKNDNFQLKNINIFLTFAQNIDCGYTLEPPHGAVLTSTHDLCFRAKIKNEYPCKPQFYYKKWGVRGSSLHGHVCMMLGRGDSNRYPHHHFMEN